MVSADRAPPIEGGWGGNQAPRSRNADQPTSLLSALRAAVPRPEEGPLVSMTPIVACGRTATGVNLARSVTDRPCWRPSTERYCKGRLRGDWLSRKGRRGAVLRRRKR